MTTVKEFINTMEEQFPGELTFLITFATIFVSAFCYLTILNLLLNTFYHNTCSPCSNDEKTVLLGVAFAVSFWTLVFGNDFLWKLGLPYIPSTLLLLKTQAWFKDESMGLHKEKRRTKEELYIQKVQSLNLVGSVLAVVITLLFSLNYLTASVEEPRYDDAFYKFLTESSYFYGFLALFLIVLAAEVLDTAANVYTREDGVTYQWFFYNSILVFGGAGLYYMPFGAFSLLLLSLFAKLFEAWVLMAIILPVYVVVGLVYFFGYYRCDPKNRREVILERRERRAAWRSVHCWGVLLGAAFAGVVNLVLFG